ncbi:NB-ARC domain-containing protein [Candidatus Paracaedibacter symbiosus]|uniref:NB-ARC domain-containing protein n=1 Tax=Candidatus Paracaedibacter symbiosus TaxID=244582 RepID=UPI0030B91CE2
MPDLHPPEKPNPNALFQVEDLTPFFKEWRQSFKSPSIGYLPDWDNKNFVVSIPPSKEKVSLGPKESYLIQLGNILHPKITTDPFEENYSKVVITGLGGIGKSQLALAYAHLARNYGLYKVIHWLDAKEKSSLIQGYRNLLKLLKEPIDDSDDISLVNSLRDALAKKQKCLLIYDNVASPEKLTDSLPNNSHILITSRYNEEGWDADNIIPLNVFRIEEAIHYLFMRTKLTDDENNLKLAKKLAHKVECLPLALAQAASYIGIKKCGLSKYIEDFKGKKAIILNYKDKKGNYPYTVATTWQITMKALSPLANQLMYLFAYLNSNNIPIDLFTNPRVGDEPKIEECIDELVLYSMIKRSEDYISVHRLVQRVARVELESSKVPEKTAQGEIKKLIDLFADKTISVFNETIDSPELQEEAFYYLFQIIYLIKHSKSLGIHFQEGNHMAYLAKMLFFQVSNLFDTPVSLLDMSPLDKIKDKRAKLMERLINLLEQKGEIIFADLTTEEASTELSWLLNNVNQNSRVVQYNLGAMFEIGIGAPTNLKKAFEWYRKAAEQSHPGAQFNLGVMYLQGRAGLPQGPEADQKAVEWYKKAAEQSHSDAQFRLGVMYKQGRAGLPKGLEADQQAMKWCKKAAEDGLSEAQLSLGVMYLEGRAGLPQGPEADQKAAEWFKKAADKDDSQAQVNLGLMYLEGRAGLPQGPEADQKAAEWFKKAADKDDSQAQFRLGLMYTQGRAGLPQGPEADQKAAEWFKKAAEKDNTNAQFRLGVMYKQGRAGLPQGPEADQKAAEWYRKAAEKGDSQAQVNLGVMYKQGRAGLPQGPEADQKAVEWYKKAAEKGDSQAQVNLGLMYKQGRAGLPQGPESDKEAAKWYKKAADKDDSQAQFNLGLMYEQGRTGLPQGPEADKEAAEWYRKAAEKDNTNAQFRLGGMYTQGRAGLPQGPESDKEAAKWYKKAADKDDSQAQFRLGVMYKQGRAGLPQGPEADQKAAEWYRKAAEKDNTNAQFRLGSMYINGQGVDKDYKESFKYFEKAAHQGDADGQALLGTMYKEGWGTEQDIQEALKWIQKAAEQGNVHGQYYLALLYRDGEGIVASDAQAIAWLHEAAKQSEDAQYTLGWMYENGRGVTKHLEEAAKWYKASEKGCPGYAIYSIGRMYEYGLNVEQDLGKAIEWYRLAAGEKYARDMYHTPIKEKYNLMLP